MGKFSGHDFWRGVCLVRIWTDLTVNFFVLAAPPVDGSQLKTMKRDSVDSSNEAPSIRISFGLDTATKPRRCAWLGFKRVCVCGAWAHAFRMRRLWAARSRLQLELGIVGDVTTTENIKKPTENLRWTVRGPGCGNLNGTFLGFSEECQKPQPPLLLKKVSQYTSHLYRNTPPICIAVLLVRLGSKEREMLSVLLPFVSQYASHLYCNTSPICIAVLLRKSWWLWSPGCSPGLSRFFKGLIDRFPEFALVGRYPPRKSLGQRPMKKRPKKQR